MVSVAVEPGCQSSTLRRQAGEILRCQDGIDGGGYSRANWTELWRTARPAGPDREIPVGEPHFVGVTACRMQTMAGLVVVPVPPAERDDGRLSGPQRDPDADLVRAVLLEGRDALDVAGPGVEPVRDGIWVAPLQRHHLVDGLDDRADGVETVAEVVEVSHLVRRAVGREPSRSTEPRLRGIQGRAGRLALRHR